MKKTKLLAVLVAVLMSVSLFSVFVGCTHTGRAGMGDEEIDPNKTQLRIGYYDGGYGREWMQEAERIYEAEHPDVQVMITYNKKRYESSALLASYQTYQEDIFIVDTAAYIDFKAEDFYYDITKAVSTPLTEYGEEESILDKLDGTFKEYYNESADPEGIKYLAVPFYDGIYAVYYDVKMFEDNSLFKDASGNWTNGTTTPKSAGKDGVTGTFDDGLPATLEEFYTLIEYIRYQLQITPFTWPGTEGYYTTKVLENFWASYEGYDNYMLNWTLDSNGEPYTFADGTSEAITVENGYKLKTGQPGKRAALQFGYDILNGGVNAGDYYSDRAFGTSQDNRAAQEEFIFSVNATNKVAFLIDGCWWEREAIESFNDLVKRTDESNAYGTRRFGLLPMPTAHGDNGELGTENIFSAVGENSQVFINKNTEVAETAVDFFRFLHTDRIMSLMTSYSNVLRPYDYVVTETDQARMTPLGKQIASLADDSNVSRVPPLLLNEEVRATSAASQYYGWQGWQFGGGSRTDITITTAYPITEFNRDKSLTVDSYLAQIAIDAASWAEAIQ